MPSIKKPKVVIDPTANITYSSYYILGLYEKYGEKNVSFGSFDKYFSNLKRTTIESFDQYVAFVLLEKEVVIKKCIVDFRDKNTIDKSAYDWCDVYGKINISISDGFEDKLVSIGPGFGIRIYSIYETIVNSMKNLFYSNLKTPVSFRKFLGSYYWQTRRSSIKSYTTPVSTCDNYIFMIATLWSNKRVTDTNVLRRKFIETAIDDRCLTFDGGFFCKKKHPEYEYFKNIVFTNRYSTKEYIEKTKKSFVVFNTPAVHDCHGWKLGEFLAMGKAIISTPLTNRLPVDLEHRKNIHFINSKSELHSAIQEIKSNKEYQIELQTGAKKYYKEHVSPVKSIEKVVSF